MTRHNNSIPHFKVKNVNVTPSAIIEWNNLDSDVKNSESAYEETNICFHKTICKTYLSLSQA